MWELFKFAFDAILPVILLIFLGYFLRRKVFINDNFISIGNKFVFKIALPCLLFYNVYSIENFADINWSVVIFSIVAIFAIFFLATLYAIFFVKDPKRKGVVLQCAFRSNFAVIGIPLTEALGGSSGIAVAALLSAFSIPVFNVLAVLSLSMFNKSSTNKVNYLQVLKKIVTNPLIIGVCLGLVVLGFRQLIPLNSSGELVFSLQRDLSFIFDAIISLSKIASPLALIVLGGSFKFSSIKNMGKEITAGVLFRLVITPLLVFTTAILLSKYTSIISFDSSVYPALIALFASPVAVSSAIMASEMDNDGELGGQLVVWTSIISIFTLFIIIVLFRSMGLI